MCNKCNVNGLFSFSLAIITSKETQTMKVLYWIGFLNVK